MPSSIPDYAADGFALFEDVLAPDEIAALVRLLPENVAGLRNLLPKIPGIRELAGGPQLRALLTRLGGGPARPVRAVFFDKNPAHNWKVPWHQDLTIAVRKHHEVPDFGPCSLKEGVPHVQPPAALLARMVILCLHLDDCNAANGALRVHPGSHLHGRLDAEALTRWDRAPESICTVRAGGVVALRPLLLHASLPARTPRHRRVIHLEYSPDPLPSPLEWRDSEFSALEMTQ